MADITIFRNSFSTIYMKAQIQSTPTASLSAYDFSSNTASFVISTVLGSTSILTKSSTSNSEITFLSLTGGELEVYIKNTDTKNLTPGKYFFTLYSIDSTSKQYDIKTGTLKLKDVVLP